MARVKGKVSAAFAPATVANVAVGFDILGFSISSAGDRVRIQRRKEAGIDLVSVSGPGADELPRDPARNCSTAALKHFVDETGLEGGFEVSLEKGIPLSSGMGGSAASSVAAVVAANAFLKKPLSLAQLLPFALSGEEVASGARHADNVAPCLWGGLILVRDVKSADVVKLASPEGLVVVVVCPDFQLETRRSRAVLRGEIALKEHVRQAADLAAFVSACYRSDWKLLSRSMKDHIVEGQRASLIPGFDSVKAAAFQAGAIGSSIAGAGPSVFAWARGVQKARKIKEAMIQTFADEGLKSEGWLQKLDKKGARLL
jgi:homoserine kinase